MMRKVRNEFWWRIPGIFRNSSASDFDLFLAVLRFRRTPAELTYIKVGGEVFTVHSALSIHTLPRQRTEREAESEREKARDWRKAGKFSIYNTISIPFQWLPRKSARQTQAKATPKIRWDSRGCGGIGQWDGRGMDGIGQWRQHLVRLLCWWEPTPLAQLWKVVGGSLAFLWVVSGCVSLPFHFQRFWRLSGAW